MSDCCTPGTGFPNSALMQQLALNHPIIWQEICAIQQEILSASSQCQPGGGQMCTTIGGNTPMTFVTGVESVTVINGGADYYEDTPSIYFEPPVGIIPPVVATGTLITNGTNIISVNITEPGVGYDPVSATLSVSSINGLGAILEPLVNAEGGIVGVDIIDGGSNYTISDTIVATRAVLPNPAYVNATFIITSVSVTGQITGIAVINPGSGYQDSVTEARIVSTLNPSLPYPLGTGFYGNVLVNGTGGITGVVITNTGAGYVPYEPYLVITDPGTGAETSVTLSGHSVGSITVTKPGSEYTTNATGTVFNPPTASLPNPPATPAVVAINTSVNNFGTNPNLYYQVWAGLTTNRQTELQLNQVVSYFTGLGYTITILQNPDTGSTIMWRVCW